jgi:hypothetical protein
MQDRKGDHCLRYRISYNVTYEYDITCRLQWVLKTDGQKRMDVAFERVFSRDNEAFGYFFSGSTLSDLQSFFLFPIHKGGLLGTIFMSKGTSANPRYRGLIYWA